MRTIYEPAKSTAKRIREELRKAFPELPASHFKVNTDTYSGGSSVHVNFTDYPFEGDVNKVIRKFSSNSFDGSIDLETHVGYNFGGFKFSGAGYVSASREISDERRALIKEILENMQDKGFIPENITPSYNEYHTYFYKIDAELTRDNYYIGNPEHIVGVTNELLGNNKEKTPLREEDFEYLSEKLKSYIFRTDAYATDDSEATHKNIEKIEELFKNTVKTLPTLNEEMTTQEKDAEKERVFEFVKTQFDTDFYKFELLPNIDDDDEFNILVDYTDKIIKNELKSLVAKYTENGFKFKKSVINDLTNKSLISNETDFSKVFKETNFPNADTPIIDGLTEGGFTQESLKTALDEALKNYVIILLEDNQVKVNLTKAEQLLFENVVSSMVRKPYVLTKEQLQTIVNHLIEYKKEDKLMFQRTFKDTLIREISNALKESFSNAYTQEEQEIINSFITDEIVNAEIDKSEQLGYVIDRNMVQIELASTIQNTVSWAKRYRTDEPILTEDRAMTAIENAISESISSAYLSGNEISYIKSIVRQELTPHIGKGITIMQDDFFIKYREEFNKLAEYKSFHDSKVNRMTNAFVQETFEMVKECIISELDGGFDHYQVNIEGNYEYENVALSQKLTHEYYQKLFSKYIEEFKEYQPNKHASTPQTDLYYMFDGSEVKAKFDMAIQRVLLGSLNEEIFRREFDLYLESEHPEFYEDAEEVPEQTEENVLDIRLPVIKANLQELMNDVKEQGFIMTDSVENLTKNLIREYGYGFNSEYGTTDMLDFLMREQYTTVLTAKDKNIIKGTLKNYLEENYKPMWLKINQNLIAFDTLLDKSIEENTARLVTSKYFGDSDGDIYETLSTYVKDNAEILLEEVKEHFATNTEISQEEKEQFLQKLVQEELQKVHDRYVTMLDNMNTNEFTDFTESEYPILVQTIAEYKDAEITEDNEGTIRYNIYKAILRDSNKKETLLYQTNKEELMNLYNSLEEFNDINLIPIDEYELKVDAIVENPLPHTELFGSMIYHTNAEFLDAKYPRITDMMGNLKRVFIYQNILNLTQDINRTENAFDYVNENQLKEEIAQEVMDLVTGSELSPINIDSYLNKSDIQEQYIATKNALNRYLHSDEVYQQNTTNVDTKGIARRHKVQYTNVKNNLVKQIAMVYNDDIHENLDTTKYRKVLRKKVKAFEKQVVDYVRESLREAEFSYKGNITYENLQTEDDFFIELLENYEDFLSEPDAETDITEWFELNKGFIDETLQKTAVRHTVENLEVDDRHGFILYKNGFSPSEFSKLNKYVQGLFTHSQRLATILAFEIPTNDNRKLVVTPKHYLLALKLIKGNVGKDILEKAILDVMVSITFKGEIKDSKLLDVTLVETLLEEISTDFTSFGTVFEAVNAQIPFKEANESRLTIVDSLFEEVLEEVKENAETKKGILIDYTKDNILENVEFKELKEKIELLVRKAIKLNITTKSRIKHEAREILIDVLSHLQGTAEYPNVFTFTYGDREKEVLSQRIRGTMSKYKEENKLTTQFKEFAETAFISGNFSNKLFTKDIAKTFSKNLADNDTKLKAVEFINEMLGVFAEQNKIAKVSEVEPLSGKAKIEGVSKRQLQLIIGQAVANFIREYEEDGITFQDIDKTIIYNHLLNKQELIAICDRVNVRIFNNKVNNNTDYNVEDIALQELKVSLDDLRTSDEFVELLEELEEDDIQEIIVKNVNMTKLLQAMTTEKVQIEFIKINGEHRKMIATRNPDLIEDDVLANQLRSTNSIATLNHQINTDQVIVYDTEVEGFRAFKPSRFVRYIRENGETQVATGYEVNEEAIKGSDISPRDMIRHLQNGVVRVVFRKVSDGTSRVMWATRNSELINQFAEENNINLNDRSGNRDRRFNDFENEARIGLQINGDYITVMSLDAKGFRTFKPSTVLDYDTEFNVCSFMVFDVNQIGWRKVMNGEASVADLYVDGSINAIQTPEYNPENAVNQVENTVEEVQPEEEETISYYEINKAEILKDIVSTIYKDLIKEPAFVAVPNKLMQKYILLISQMTAHDIKTNDDLQHEMSQKSYLTLNQNDKEDILNNNFGESILKIKSNILNDAIINDITQKDTEENLVRLESDLLTKKLLFDLQVNNTTVTAEDFMELYSIIEQDFFEKLTANETDKLRAMLATYNSDINRKDVSNKLTKLLYTNLADEIYEKHKDSIEQALTVANNESENVVEEQTGFIPSENDVTFKNINVNELIYLIQHNLVTVKFRKKPTKKFPDGELRILTGTRNIEIAQRYNELTEEQIQGLELLNTKERVASELSKGTIAILDVEINEGRNFTLARLVSYEVQGQEPVIVEDVAPTESQLEHFNPKAENTFITKEDMYDTLKNKVVRVTFRKADGNERVLWATTNYELIKNYFVRDLTKLKYDANKEVLTAEENREQQLESGLFKVLDLEAQSYRSFKFDNVVEFNELHKVSSWIEFEPNDMGWFNVMKGNAYIKDLENVGHREAKPTTTVQTHERIALEAENRANFEEAETILERLKNEAEANKAGYETIKTKYNSAYQRLEIALEKVAEAEEKIANSNEVPNYSKEDLASKLQQEQILANMIPQLINQTDDSIEVNAFLKPKQDKDMTNVLVITYKAVKDGIVYEGLDSIITNPRFILNGVSYEVVTDLTNTFHFGTGSVIKSLISPILLKVMKMLKSTIITPKKSLAVLGTKLNESDSQRLVRLSQIVELYREKLTKEKVMFQFVNATDTTPAHAKFITREGNKNVVWQVTPAYIYNETDDKILYVRQNPASTSKEWETYLNQLKRFITSQATAEQRKDVGIHLKSVNKLDIFAVLTTHAFNLRKRIQ